MDKNSNTNNTNNNNNYNKIPLIETYIDAFASSLEFYSRLNSAFIDALSVPFKDARQDIKNIRKEYLVSRYFFVDYNQQQEFYKKIEKIILFKIRSKFDLNFREKSFLTSLSEFIESYSNLAHITGMGRVYQQMSNLNAYWNNTFIEHIRDRFFRTPSHIVYSENKYSLFHYHLPSEKEDKTTFNFKKYGNSMQKSRIKTHPFTSSSGTSYKKSIDYSTPLLIIYAFINRNYIFDLLPDLSIIRNFQRQGFDVFATDWGTPSAYDKELTLEHYVNKYLANAVDYIKEHVNSDKVSILGYCWGGNLALMLAALYPEKIQNIITFATPGDFSLDNNLLSIWMKNINTQSLLDSFGNIPSTFINSAFLLRSPIDYLHKYSHFFLEEEVPKDIESIMQFIATEVWLYDSPPVIGDIYRQFVEDCYKKNLFIKNEMTTGENNKIDLSKIKQPYLNIIAKRDDLVAPESSRAINEVIGSTDKSIIEFDSGHVGACISPIAHQELWPKVGNWLKQRCK